MYHKHDEIYFENRKEALSHLPWLEGIVEDNPILEDFTLYQCARCGCSFASTNPSTDTGAIICAICEGEILRR